MSNTSRIVQKTVFAVTVAILLAGCYHARIQTGLEPSARVVEKPFASGWLYGLIGPELDVSEECTSGVAEVETKLSFVNQLVSFITLSIYTPMNLEVTCAASGAMGSANPDQMIQISRISSEAAKAGST